MKERLKLIYLNLLMFVYCQTYEQQEVQFLKTLKDKKLIGMNHIFQHVSHINCLTHCGYYVKDCHSVNHHAGQNICMINLGPVEEKKKKFIDANGWSYYEKFVQITTGLQRKKVKFENPTTSTESSTTTTGATTAATEATTTTTEATTAKTEAITTITEATTTLTEATTTTTEATTTKTTTTAIPPDQCIFKIFDKSPHVPYIVKNRYRIASAELCITICYKMKQNGHPVAGVGYSKASKKCLCISRTDVFHQKPGSNICSFPTTV